MSEKFETLISQIESLTVKELADLVKMMEEKFGITAGAPMAASRADGAGGERSAVARRATI